MLIVRRREGESVIIAGEIEIEILELGPTRVKLGIKAPQQVAVVRGEVRLTEAENRAAAGASRQGVAGLLRALEKNQAQIRLGRPDKEVGADLPGIQILENPEPGKRPG